MMTRIMRWIRSWTIVDVDDVVIVPIGKWHALMSERDRLREEVARLRDLVRSGL